MFPLTWQAQHHPSLFWQATHSCHFSKPPPVPTDSLPKPLGTARFKRSEIISKAASKRSFCVSCEARNQALPRSGRAFGWFKVELLASLTLPQPLKNGAPPHPELTNYCSLHGKFITSFYLGAWDFWMNHGIGLVGFFSCFSKKNYMGHGVKMGNKKKVAGRG